MNEPPRIPVPTARPKATLIVLATGYLGRRIARLAAEQESFDPCGRRVLRPGDAGYPEPRQIEAWRRGTTAVAVMLNMRGEVCERLDPQRATAPAWIEDAFLRSRREP
jgi:hypothetical protein